MTPLAILLGVVAALAVWAWAVRELLRNFLPPIE